MLKNFKMDNTHCMTFQQNRSQKILNYTLTSKVVETVNNVLYDQNYSLALMGIWWVYNDCNTKSLTAEKNNVYYPIIRFLFYSTMNNSGKIDMKRIFTNTVLKVYIQYSCVKNHILNSNSIVYELRNYNLKYIPDDKKNKKKGNYRYLELWHHLGVR